MFCPACGKDVGESDAFCRSCGRLLSADKPRSVKSAQTSGVTGQPEQPLQRSGEATASLILGLFSFIPVVGLLAVIFGHLAKASIRRSGGRLLGEGMAGVGLVMGYLGLAGWIIYVFVRLSPPSRIEANERLAISSLRLVNTCAEAYSSRYDTGYPPDLASLGSPKNASPNLPTEEYEKLLSAKAAGLIPEGLASGTQGGYRFNYSAGKSDATGRINEYTIHADPLEPGISGNRHFFTDSTQVIRVERDKEASTASPPLGEE